MGLAIEVALVPQAGVEVAAFTLQVFVLCQRIATYGVGFGVVVGLAVGPFGAAGLVDFAIEPGLGVTVVVGADVDVFFHHLMARLKVPDGILRAAAQAGLWVVRQFNIELVVALIVVKLDHVDAQPIIAGEAVPDADLEIGRASCRERV